MKFVYLLCILAYLLTSCSTTISTNPKDYPFTLMSRQAAFNFLCYTNDIKPMYGQCAETTSDPYCIPTVAWIQEVYAPYLKSFLAKNGVSFYKAPENNCVRFSNYAVTAGTLLHFKEHEGLPGSSLSIGVVDYASTLTGWHSINIFIAQDKSGKLVVVYFEPQNQSIVPSKEVDSEWILVRM